jgi:hypothetical protein
MTDTLFTDQDFKDDALRISRLAKAGHAFGKCGKMCNECAFKHGSDANGRKDTITGAVLALESRIYLMHGYEFYCHKQTNGEERSQHMCAGFMLAVQALTKGPFEQKIVAIIDEEKIGNSGADKTGLFQQRLRDKMKAHFPKNDKSN